MSVDTAYTRTFSRAVESLGSAEKLAAALGVSVGEIESWVAGLTTPPAATFLQAIDIVARGQFRAQG